MSETANPTRVGLFVVGAVALAIGAVAVFGSMQLFVKSERFEIHFQQSLMGLSLGAPVIFQGVQVGTVVDIYAEYDGNDPPVIRTPVIIELVGQTVRRPGVPEHERNIKEGVSKLVATGMRAQLDVQSLVTGQCYVNLVIDPEAKPATLGDGDLPVIPSVASDLQMLKETLLSLARELGRMPIQDIGSDLVAILDGLAELARAPETRDGLAKLGELTTRLDDLAGKADASLQGASDDFRTVTAKTRDVLDTADRALQDFDRVVAPGSPLEQEALAALKDLQATLAEVSSTTEEIGSMTDRALEDVGKLVAPGSTLQYELQSTLQEIRRATQKLGAVADQLLAQPDSVLFGRGQRKDAP